VRSRLGVGLGEGDWGVSEPGFSTSSISGNTFLIALAKSI
jgi:hypothetical protein